MKMHVKHIAQSSFHILLMVMESVNYAALLLRGPQVVCVISEMHLYALWEQKGCSLRSRKSPRLGVRRPGPDAVSS